MTPFGSNYGTPGWQRAQAATRRRARRPRAACFATTASTDGRRRTTTPRSPLPGGDEVDRAKPGRVRRARRSGEGRAPSPAPAPPPPLTIEGELVAKSTGTVSDFAIGDRVFHQKFGNGNVTAGRRQQAHHPFDKAGEKRVVDSFVERV